MSKIKCIYLDMDGVICDMQRHVFSLFSLTKGQVEDAYAHTTDWEAMPRALSEVTDRPYTAKDMWGKVEAHSPEFWETIPWTPYGYDLFMACWAVAPVVLMSTPMSDPDSAAGKKAWINRELGSDQRFALTNCKHHFAHEGAVLVDDARHNVDKFKEHGGKAFLWPQPWNGAREANHATVEQLKAWLEQWQ